MLHQCQRHQPARLISLRARANAMNRLYLQATPWALNAVFSLLQAFSNVCRRWDIVLRYILVVKNLSVLRVTVSRSPTHVPVSRNIQFRLVLVFSLLRFVYVHLNSVHTLFSHFLICTCRYLRPRFFFLYRHFLNLYHNNTSSFPSVLAFSVPFSNIHVDVKPSTMIQFLINLMYYTIPTNSSVTHHNCPWREDLSRITDNLEEWHLGQK